MLPLSFEENEASNLYMDIHIFELPMGRNTWIYIFSSCPWQIIPGHTNLRVVNGKEYLDIHIFELSMARNTWISISLSCPWEGIPGYTYLRVVHGKEYLDIPQAFEVWPLNTS